MGVKVTDPRDIDGAVNESLSKSSSGLTARDLNAFEGMTGSNYANTEGYNSKDPAEVKAREDANQATWDNNTTERPAPTRRQFARQLVKKGGPFGGLLAVLVGVGALLSGAFLQGSLIMNLKENLTLSWDQQNITAEVRANKILNKRLASEAITCKGISICEKFSKPSNKVLKDLDAAGIKALNADGTVMEKNRLIAGDRPAHYVTPDGIKATPAEFKNALEKDPAFRNAFRRAYNPRWVNWFDDAAMNFLHRLGMTKAIDKSISEATDSKAVDKAIASKVDAKTSGLGATDDAVEKGLSEMLDTEAEKFAKTTAHDLSGKGDAALLVGGGICAAAKVPGVYVSILSKLRMAQMAAVVMSTVLTVADATKAGQGTERMTEITGNLLTERQYVKNTTTGAMELGKSAMDSGAILYGVVGDRGSAAKSKTVKEYMPGYTGNSTLNVIAAAGNNPQLKTVCDAVSSNEAQVTASAIKAIKASSGPAGWIALAVDGVVMLLDNTGALNAIIETVMSKALDVLKGVIDWKALIPLIMGDLVKNAKNERFGDMVGVLATVMASKSNHVGNLPLKARQKMVFDDQITKPVKLAWAEEDRLTHSPLDVSNPNTFMGSITTQLIPYYSTFSSVDNAFGSLFKLVGKIPTGLIAPSASAASEADWQMCPEDGDYAVATSGVAAGPLCDVQYGIPAGYMGVDPGDVVKYLYDQKQIDSDGKIITGSDLENWKTLCNGGDSYSLSQCTVSDDDKKHAYYGLYQIDSQLIDGMDNEPKASGSDSSGGSSSATSGGSVSMVDPSKWAVSKDSDGLINKSSDQWNKWVAALGGNGNSSTGVLTPIGVSGGNICPQSNTLNTNGGGNKFNPNAAASATALMRAFDTANPGRYLIPGACFRSISAQQAAWDNFTKAGGNEAAPVGSSNHGWGLAIDFRISTNATGMGASISSFTSADYTWMKSNAYQFGWINPKKMQPAGGCSGSSCEPWHFQYLGPLYGG